MQQLVQSRVSVQSAVGVEDILKWRDAVRIVAGAGGVGVDPGVVERHEAVALIEAQQRPHALHGGVQHPEGYVVGGGRLRRRDAMSVSSNLPVHKPCHQYKQPSQDTNSSHQTTAQTGG